MTTNKSINRMFLVMVIIYIGVSLLIGKNSSVELPMNVLMILSEALILIPALLYCGIKKVSIKEWIPFKKMKLPVWILIIVCTYLMYPLLIVLNAISLIFVESGTAELMGVVSDGGFVIATLLIAVIPAFAEEFVFRGVMFGNYKKSRMLPAIFMSAFLFGCMHMNFNQFLYAFMLGIYLAFLVEATGSILSSMLAHFVINFTSVIMSFALNHMQNAVAQLGDMAALEEQMMAQSGNFLNTMDQSSLLMLVVGVIFWLVIAVGTTAGAVGIYIAICKISGRWEHVKGMFRQGTRERIITISIVAAIVLMVAVMVYSAVV